MTQKGTVTMLALALATIVLIARGRKPKVKPEIEPEIEPEIKPEIKPVIWDSENTVNRESIGFEEPDGNYAAIYGREGSFVTIKLADRPTMVESITVYLFNPFPYTVTSLLALDVSIDDEAWQTFRLGGDKDPGPWEKTVTINEKIMFARIRQWATGVEMLVDAVVGTV